MAVDNVVLTIARRIIASSNPAVRTIFDTNRNVRDAITAISASNIPENPRLSRDRPEAHIYRRLAHIIVNPNNEHNTKLLCDAYVYAGGKRHSPAGETVANRNSNSEKDLLENLINTAQDLRELSQDNTRDDPTGELFAIDSVFLLRGEKGSGKTFFLNHLLSAHSERFDERRVVWVRLNLVDDHQFGPRLHHWMFAQMAKILLRYYDEESDYFIRRPAGFPADLYRHLLEFIRGSAVDELRSEQLKSLERMRQVFSRRGNDIDISPDYCDEILCVELFRYAKQCGVGFVVALDGFDRLDSDTASVVRFRELEQGIRSLLNANSHLGAVVILTVRVGTYDAISHSNPYSVITTRTQYLVESVPITEIVKARVNYLHSEIGAIRKNNPEPWKSQDWDRLLDEFATEHLFENPDFLSISNGLIASSNNRAKLQLVQLKWQEFVQERTGQGYRLIENMLKCGMRFPSVVFKYRKVGDALELEPLSKGIYDNRHLPLIFRPPLLEGSAPEKEWYSASSVLHGLRILQLLRSHDALNASIGPEVDKLTVGELSLLMNRAFGYPEEQTNLFLRELDSYEVIRLRYTFPMEFWAPQSQIKCLPILDYILDRCAIDPAYLNLCAMRVPVRGEGPNTAPLFEARFINPLLRGSLSKWVHTKIRNTIALLAIVRYANNEQKISYQSRQKIAGLNERLSRTLAFAVSDGLFDIADEMTAGTLANLSSVMQADGRAIKEEALIAEMESLEKSFHSY